MNEWVAYISTSPILTNRTVTDNFDKLYATTKFQPFRIL